ncbi:MAG: adenylate kinase [Deltaproteobacteria bacterium]
MDTQLGLQLVLLGPPGAGKGTQANLLIQKVAIPHISTGDILRAEARKGSELGREARTLMDKGQLVPDDLMLRIVAERLKADDCANGFLLDGFPRSRPQARALEVIVTPSETRFVAACLDVPCDVVVRRLSGRRTCRDCGAMFQVEFSPPKVTGICDRCESELYQRDDDCEDVIQARLKIYNEETQPLLEFYGKRDQLVSVDGTGAAIEVAKRLHQALGVES